MALCMGLSDRGLCSQHEECHLSTSLPIGPYICMNFGFYSLNLHKLECGEGNTNGTNILRESDHMKQRNEFDAEIDHHDVIG